MKKIYKIYLPCLLAAAFLGGCADLPFFGDSKGSTSRREGASASQSALREGIHRYNEGDFNGAIQKLGSNDIANGPTSTRVTALKYTAFSYCVTSRPTQCRQAFDKAFKLDPSFELAAGEHGHPQWGPVFSRAKKER